MELYHVGVGKFVGRCYVVVYAGLDVNCHIWVVFGLVAVDVKLSGFVVGDVGVCQEDEVGFVRELVDVYL